MSEMVRNIPLVEWKAANLGRITDDNGYMLVPDEILIPYACADVDAPIRSAPVLIKRLMLDNTWDYYCNFRHNLVTDIFTQFALLGLPILMPKLDNLRELYSYSRTLLERKFVQMIHEEARSYLMRGLLEATNNPEGLRVFHEIEAFVRDKQFDLAMNHFKSFVGAAKLAEWLPTLQHYIDAPAFNIRSNPHKLRWLFDVKKHKPIKSTNNKEKGLPSIPWERVMNMPQDIRRLYNPAADKQTLKILADDHGDVTVKKLLDVLAVGNVCKAFLKEAELDDNGELVKENGLHYWIASDGRIHGNMSVTETGRPRAWKPNSLNWPSYVHEGVARGIAEVLIGGQSEEDMPVVTKDALAGKHGEYEIVLANPPFGKKSSVTIVNEAGESSKESLIINRMISGRARATNSSAPESSPPTSPQTSKLLWNSSRRSRRI